MANNNESPRTAHFISLFPYVQKCGREWKTSSQSLMKVVMPRWRRPSRVGPAASSRIESKQCRMVMHNWAMLPMRSFAALKILIFFFFYDRRRLVSIFAHLSLLPAFCLARKWRLMSDGASLAGIWIEARWKRWAFPHPMAICGRGFDDVLVFRLLSQQWDEVLELGLTIF